MPHHGVCRDAVTTKLQVVFDTPSRALHQPSLNSVLPKGPNGPKFDTNLLRLLFVIQFHVIVLVADFKKAYLQMVIPEQDRRLAFFFGLTVCTPSRIHSQWRMTRVLQMDATSSPLLLAAMISHHLCTLGASFPKPSPVSLMHSMWMTCSSTQTTPAILARFKGSKNHYGRCRHATVEISFKHFIAVR